MSDKDTIYRQDAIDALADYIHNVDKVMGTGHLTADDCKDAAASVFEELPSAQPDRKRGKWIWDVNGMDWGLGAWCCSECGVKAETWWANDERYNPLKCSGGRFCGNCGAYLRGEE